jgi:hypothetical protein
VGPAPACPGARDFLKPHLRVQLGRRWTPRETELRLGAAAGVALGDLPPQEMYLVGGRGTVPGYPYRAYAREHLAVANASLSADLLRPWLRGRLTGAAGYLDPGFRPSLGIGVGIFHDILQVDLARGLAADGRWELVVEANPSFWDFL